MQDIVCMVSLAELREIIEKMEEDTILRVDLEGESDGEE